MASHLNKKRILIFLAIAFGVPWAVDLAIYLSGGMKNNPLQWATLANYVAISTPAVANVVTRLITREGWGHLWLRPNFRRGWRLYLAAWLLPLLAVIVGGTIFYLLFPQSFDPNLGQVQQLFKDVPEIKANPWLGMLSITLQIMIISMIINGIVSIGEEFGWRAYLLPKLTERFSGGEPATAFGGRIAALLIGIIWGVWHWPLFLLGASAGTPSPNLLVYLVFTCSLSVILSWVALRSGSVWPASIGHGIINATSALPVFLLKGPDMPLLGPAPTGLIGGVGFFILALVLFLSTGALRESKEAVVTPAQITPGRVSA